MAVAAAWPVGAAPLVWAGLTACGRRLRLLGRLLRLLGFLRLALGLDARIHIEKLPAENDQHRESDRNEIIAVVFHHTFLGRPSFGRLCFGLLSTRAVSSALNSWKDAVRQSLRATIT